MVYADQGSVGTTGSPDDFRQWQRGRSERAGGRQLSRFPSGHFYLYGAELRHNWRPGSPKGRSTAIRIVTGVAGEPGWRSVGKARVAGFEPAFGPSSDTVETRFGALRLSDGSRVRQAPTNYDYQRATGFTNRFTALFRWFLWLAGRPLRTANRRWPQPIAQPRFSTLWWSLARCACSTPC